MNLHEPIAIFDSGVGGLSVLREVHKLLPTEDLLYFGDQANVPYGPRSPAEIYALTEQAVSFFLQEEAKAIVIACNTASAFALHELRAAYPDVPFVGMEPAVKPAAAKTQTGVIGVLMTEATKQGRLYKSVVDRFASNHVVLSLVCPDFVTLVEAGNLVGETAEEAVRNCLHDALTHHADQLVLGCTHFGFLTPTIQKVAGAGVTIVDPSPAVARQVKRITTSRRNISGGSMHLYTTSSEAGSRQVMSHLSGVPVDEIKHYSPVSS